MAKAFFKMSRSRSSAVQFFPKFAHLAVEGLGDRTAFGEQLGLPAIDKLVFPIPKFSATELAE